MRFDMNLRQRLEQRMVLAPRMIQAMEILQLPLMALQERIDQELITNPVLEIRQTAPENPADETAEETPASIAETERELVIRDDGGNQEDFERLGNLVDRWDTYFEEAAAWQRPRVAAGEPDPKTEAIQNAPDRGATLQDVMLADWHLEDAPPRALELGELVIRNLDDDGYLRIALEELAREAEPPASVEEMEDVLARVQRVGPIGVGARTLQECLLLQLATDPLFGDGPGALPDDALEVRLIRDHLHDIEANRYPQMAKALGVEIEDIKAAVETIRHLNPRPGAAVSPRRTPTIVLDARIEWDDELGEWRITVEKRGTPELYISRAYRRLVKRRDLDDKTRRFVARNIRSARWLIDAIEQRGDTLQRVVESIVKFQRPFFDDGPAHLHPLKMQEVADDVRRHVATISRAVADKYADTPWGIYALRNFFTGGTQTAQGEEVSWDQVRLRLKQIVEEEDKRKPLSDEALAGRLRAEGIDVARRTVAKYREELDIPSSRRRREY
ncbi:MAG TPA: RNA polymerase factor sigma-54 [Phycisphaerae bacterium]|nr:RNA polymerase factor sigma-54 [Phycisphaerae bacterium]